MGHTVFLVLKEYEKATNAKVNVDKTEALWVGKWKNRTDKPLNLKWTNSHIKFLGIYVGNKVGASGTKNIADLNFAEQIESIKNKMSYWRGKGVSIMGRAKVLNIFILSRLWYRTQVITPSKEHFNTLNKMIRDFIWNDKKGGRIRQGVLNLSNMQGGIQLVDIDTKIKTQRVQRIMKILKMDKDTFERFLADSLIGLNNSLGLNGISYGIMKNLNRIKQIEHFFIKKLF